MPSITPDLSLTDTLHIDLDPDNELKHNPNPDTFDFLNSS